ncbi:MAG: SCO6745 family protein [Ilumatobacteraceae bacterium]
MQSTARFLWQRLEPYHGLIYFVPEADEHYVPLGLDPGMMGYFGSRAAAMGAVTGDVVVATFFNFEPSRVHAAVPEVWRRTTPAALWQARLAAVDAALRRLFGDRVGADEIARAAELLRRIVPACRPEGRSLFAGHLSQAWPDEPHLALWFGISLLREYRGDGHIAALTAEGVSGIEALVIHGATGAVPPKVLQATRAWGDEDWAAARRGLVARGWLSHEGTLTEVGRAHRDEVERRTDELAAAPWALVDDDEQIWLAALGKDLSATIVAAGTFPAR